MGDMAPESQPASNAQHLAYHRGTHDPAAASTSQSRGFPSGSSLSQSLRLHRAAPRGMLMSVIAQN